MVRARIDREGTHNARVVVAGEIDMACVPLLTEVIGRSVEQYRDTVVDLRDADFIDSSGIGVLVDALNDATRQGRGYRVCGSCDMVRRAMEVTGVRLALTNGVQPRPTVG